MDSRLLDDYACPSRWFFKSAASWREGLQSKVGLLDDARGSVEKSIAENAVDHAMVVGQREIHHRADCDRILAVHFDNHRALLQLPHPENAELRLVDNREAKKISFAARVRERKAATSQIVRGYLAIRHLAAQALDFARDADYGHALGPFDYRNEQALFGVHRDAKVDLPANHKRVAGHGSVHTRKFLQRADGGGGHQRQHREREALAFLEGRLMLFAQAHHRAHVHLRERSYVRRMGFGINHVLSDQLAPAAEGFDDVSLTRLIYGRRVHGGWRGGRRRGCGLLGGSRLAGRRGGAAQRIQVLEQIALGDAPVYSGAGDTVKVDAVLLRHPHYHW